MPTPLRDQTVLVTGAAGFVGAHLVEALVDENTVIALDHFQTTDPAQLPAGARIVEGDIRDADTLRRAAADADYIFHQAAAGGAARSIDAPVETHSVNVAATRRLLAVAHDVDARVLLASSAAIYGEPATLPIQESAPKTPATPYGVQKLAVDRVARQYAVRDGLETVVLRYFNVYGRHATDPTVAGAVGTFIEDARDPLHGRGAVERTRRERVRAIGGTAL